MKNFLMKYSSVIAAFALMVTTVVENSACIWITHQEKMPENARRLRKF
ncbi:MAG: cyclic lactone autoinducer peptide [Ruminococcus sp.]|nr:cyclic lactone autoinducer peptide [Ruminococcus sp.]